MQKDTGSGHLPRRATKSNTETDKIISEAQLNEEFSLILRMNKENEMVNLVRFNLQKRQYKPITTFDYSITLIDGSIVPKMTASDLADKTVSGEDEESHVLLPKLVKNKFNFSNRSTQTTTAQQRHQLMQTEPSATATFSGNSGQGTIFDAYIKRKEKKKIESDRYSISLHPSVNRLAEITERMVFQNLHDYVLEDFKYYEDPADEVRGNIGCLLPLWIFASDKTKYLSVTSVCWSPQHSDLFAVSFGSFSFTKEGEGAICLYSLKNPSYPTYSILTECGVMSIDINRQFSHYLCAGFCDSTVAVYNLSEQTCEPEQRSQKGVHNMHISQIQWDKRVTDELNFYSVSPDGLIVKWTLVKNGLKHHVQITLGISDCIENYTVEMQMTVFGSGITLDFHASNNNLYLVGTEMGQVHLCLSTHLSEPLQTFDAHYLSVYKIAWNTFHPKVFITCSEDWTVKIWEHKGKIRNPLFEFDLGSQVYDVKWAPFSSTVFAAVTANGEVFVYDLAIDKTRHLCEQVVFMLKNTRAMYVTFNRRHPVILVGNDKGAVSCLKLSPNLRKLSKSKSDHAYIKDTEKFQIAKLEDILETIR